MMAALYKTKKALRESIGKPLRYRETSMFGEEYRANGKFCVVGPSEHERKWFAEVTMRGGLIALVDGKGAPKPKQIALEQLPDTTKPESALGDF